MSQQKVFQASKDTVQRISTDGATHQGCGLSKHTYVGRYGAWDYASFIEFTLDWTDVGKIVSATLNLYTDEYDTAGLANEPGIFNAPADTDKPKVTVYRLTSEFTEGANVDGHYDSGDYENPTRISTGGAVDKYLTPNGADLLHTIDITAIVRAWAPATVEGGGRATNHGIGLYATGPYRYDTRHSWSGWAKQHAGGGGASERPTITLVYEYGSTVPNTPTSLTPSGTVASLATFEGDFSDVRSTDTLQSTEIAIFDGGTSCTVDASTNQVVRAAHGLKIDDVIYFTSLTGGAGLSLFTGYRVAAVIDSSNFTLKTLAGTLVDVTTNYSAATYSKIVKQWHKDASNSERVAYHFILSKPSDFIPTTGKTYRWRAQVTDNEGQKSAWTSLVSFALSNTAPGTPVLKPIDNTSVTTLNLQKFEGGTFSDTDGDVLRAHQVQLSPFPAGNVGWDDADGILWDSGKVFDPLAATSWVEYYGGRALTAGTYYWRARQWDSREGVSAWATPIRIVLSADFNPDPGSYSNVQIDPHAPWRILIRDLYQSDGVTPTVGRAPGNLIAVFEEAKNVGASIVYNSPGELHFTLLKDDEQIGVIEPKQVHYAVEFYSGDGWQEKFAGVIWDVDATETDVIFKGIDYLALYDTVIDERYDPLKPNKSYASGGSFYENVTIKNVILDQLNRAKALTDSWVGFITIGTIDAMNELVTVYSTMQPVLSFCAGLIDSHRQGTGKRTRMKVVKTTTGTYQLLIVDDPGIIRSDLALYYGELVQGYRVIIFGDGWANVQHIVGRNRDGAKVVYQTISNKPFQPSTSVYGRIATVAVMDGVQDQNDLTRRGLQAAIQAAKLGKQVAIGIRTEYLAPLQGWDVCDVFPLKILDGAIDTDRFGSGYWAAYAGAWEATDIGEQSLIITLLPREDSSAPDPDLIPSAPVLSTQPEWQIDWVPPTVFGATAKFYLDQSTGMVYTQQSDGTYLQTMADPRNNNLLVNSGFEMEPIATVLLHLWDLTAEWATATQTVNLATGTGTLGMTTSTY